MSLPDDYTITKVLVFFAVEKSLREINDTIFEKVVEILKKKYNSYLYDCYDHPEYLNQVLKDYFSDSFVAITEKIKKYLAEYSSRTKVKHFIKVVCSG
ncbi:MAG: hypothetical protein FJ356_00815 [Thaumarchaeota archaeon]|nr:hypothetical protein [Nitrososphaerota archaeon]